MLKHPRALLRLHRTRTKWLRQETAVTSTERQTITPLNPKDNVQTHIHIDITPENLFIYLRGNRGFSAQFCQTPLLSYPSQNCLFFSLGPIKVIMCQRGKRNMMIMITTVKTRRGSLWMRHRCKGGSIPSGGFGPLEAGIRYRTGAKRRGIKADP